MTQKVERAHAIAPMPDRSVAPAETDILLRDQSFAAIL
ncbi:hypothetical protein ACVIGV_004809 [Rhizobium leguminosarum]